MDETATCPHCGQPGIVVSRYYYTRGYTRGWPAKCRKCGGLSYDGPHALVAIAGCLPELWILLIIGLWITFPRTFSVIALAAIPLLIYYWWRQRGRPRVRPGDPRPFRPISPESSRLSRRLTWLSILIISGAFLYVLFAPR